jgi:hypothetical protein
MTKISLQTLIFNTTTKHVSLLDGPRGNSLILETFDNVSTVKVNVGHYEIMQKVNEDSNSTYPVMRVPISNTNMIIVK